MLNKELDPYGVMGFVTFETLPGVETEQVIETSLKWQRDFLSTIDGMGFHCLLGNLNGNFADIIFGTDKLAFARMAEAFPTAPSSAALMKLLDPQKINMRSVEILKSGFCVPADFSCVEAGFMTAGQERSVTTDQVIDASNRVEDEYLEAYSNTKGHFVGKTSEEGFCEVTFGQTLGQTREICFGYEMSKVCSDYLGLFDEKSFEFDFWFPLA